MNKREVGEGEERRRMLFQDFSMKHERASIKLQKRVLDNQEFLRRMEKSWNPKKEKDREEKGRGGRGKIDW